MAEARQTRSFDAAAEKLLNLTINSLYSNKEIFLRELISNSSDALNKLRFLNISEPTKYPQSNELKIQLDIDVENKVLTITDTGIGMSFDDVVENLGTIAKSGTEQFLGSLTGNQAQDSQLIGKFGVGFYSAFIVADKVIVETRRADCSATDAVRWESQGKGEYDIENITKDECGTVIKLFFKDSEKEMLNDWKIKQIIAKYSNHIGFPIYMLEEKIVDAENESAEEQKDSPKTFEYKKVNSATAMWMRSKKELEDEDYDQFARDELHLFEAPLAKVHSKVEGKLEYTSLLYIPSKAPFDLWNRDAKYGLKLYINRVFIMDDVEQFLPTYLRFIRGVLDSNDLDLNISRETLQSNNTVESIKNALAKRVLNLLEDLATNEPEKYQSFFNEFGQVLKEGPAEDLNNKERIAKLLRFASTHNDTEQKVVSLEDYISRMQEGQSKIYYVTADTFAAAKNSPYLELLREKGIEALLLSDKIDEWMMSNLSDFQNKKFQSLSKGDLDLSEIADKSEQEAHASVAKEHEDLVKRVKDFLQDKVKEVRISARLKKTPACIVVDENEMGLQMQRIMQAAGQFYGGSKPIFELNPHHPLVKQINQEQNQERFNNWVSILYDQALLAESGQLPDPASFVNKLNEMLVEVAVKA